MWPYTGEDKDDIEGGAVLFIFVEIFWTREGEQHLRWTDLEDFNVSTIIIEVAIKGLSCIEENRLLTTDNVISPSTTCDLTQEETRMSGFSRDSHVARWEPCMIQVIAFQSPALWVSRETEMLLLLCHRVLDVCPTSKICIPLTTYCNANRLLL